MTSASIRQAFLDFFEQKGHKIVPSAPIVVKNDPTLMFTNAGMNQFKDIFLGDKAATAKRIADTQKCLRVSGKHNDLEEVGLDTYHHTMFEMLGNWSFGDYFKKEAIEWAWELLTGVYKIEQDRIYVTIFGGDELENMPLDQEAHDIWAGIVAKDRIINGSKADNFWEMGDNGPCGPCSEIHIDIRSDEERQKEDGAKLVNQDHPQVIEVWNLVFIELNRKWESEAAHTQFTEWEKANKSKLDPKDFKQQRNANIAKATQLLPLPEKHIDTGMGFERLCMVLQGKQSNYDTDVFQPMIQYLGKKAGKQYGEDEQVDIAMRVIADHIRAVAFCIADGQLIENSGAGYVIKRILRRAVRYGYSFLGFNEPVIYELVAIMAEQMGANFPELPSQLETLQKTIKEEEGKFLNTLANGLKRIALIQNEMQGDTIEGKAAFELYDTYGFPFDLTQLIARENGLKVDEAGFEEAMRAHKDDSRQHQALETGEWHDVVADGTEVAFVGYDDLEATAKVLKYRKAKVKNKDQFQIVLDKTPFYAESGGQIGDKGIMDFEGDVVRVLDTKKENELIVHFTDKLPANIEATVTAKVDATKRQLTMNNHSVTHLLHAALRRVLGDHVQQKGSLVGPDYLRFDFSHSSKVTEEELEQIEAIVNQKIQQNIPLDEKRAVPKEEALKMGATALFGEKYGDFVRVIIFEKGFSTELCGGTHVAATGQIGLFKITSESAIAAGVRRIEAITAEKALGYLNSKANDLHAIGELIKQPKNVVKGVEDLLAENQKLKKELETLGAMQVNALKGDLKNQMTQYNHINFIGTKVTLNNADQVKDLAFSLKKEIDNLFLVVGAEINGKANLTVMIDDALVADKNLNASQLVKEWAKAIQGGGGGQPFYATAGGKNPDGLDQSIQLAKEFVANLS